MADARLAKRIYRRALSALPDPVRRRVVYASAVGLGPPRTFTQKIVHRKLFEHDPRMPALADKIAVKAIVARRIGDRFITPTLYAGRTLPPLAERTWPLPFVVKASHRSGAVYFAKTAADLDWPRIDALCRQWTATLYGQSGYEWAYSQIEPGVLVEPYIGEEFPPPDFRFFVFAGRTRMIQIDMESIDRRERASYNRDWQRLKIAVKRPDAVEDVSRPLHYDEMLAAAEALGADWNFVRVDLYDLPSGPRFGEMTLYPSSGAQVFNPPEANDWLGAFWK